MSTLKTTNITHESNTGTTNLALGTTGNVTIGGSSSTTDQGYRLTLQGSANASYFQFFDSTTGTTHGSDGTLLGLINGDTYLYNREAKSMIFGTSNNERMRIASDGNVGIGITSPVGKFAVSDGTRTAEINPHSNGTYIGNRTDHPLLFQINASEKGRITTGGDLCWGCTSTTSLGTQTGYDNVSTFNQSGITLTAYGVTTGLYYDRLNYTNSQYYIVNESGVGVYLGDGSTSWTAHSDERLKKDIVELDGTKAWNHVKAAKAASFKWNVAGYPTDTKLGFIAQDWETNYPEVINITDETIDGISNPKGIQYTETIPVLMAALKQAITEIEKLKTTELQVRDTEIELLKNRVSALESG